MSLESEKIQGRLKEALNTLAETEGDGLARQLQPILLANLDRGRVHSFLEGNPGRIPDYVRRVAEAYTSLNPYLHKLQTERSAEAWGPLFERMQTWAYNFFLRKNFARDNRTREIAVECATEAAVSLLNAHFPYDTEFEPWAHILVQNTCRKYIQHAFRKSEVPQDKKVDLDDSDNLASPNEELLEMDALQREAGHEIMEAMKQLSEARRQVIQAIYFDEMEPEETARRMGRSVGAIYSLQFQALKDLRKILSTIRDRLND
jgi:RNA polymerase sigma factor (sigma-70 family)